MDEDNIEHMEEYHNCGYAGIYESEEKAIILKCIGRGLKLPPLSEIYFPSSISKNHSRHTMDVRPSHHVLDLMAPALTTQEPDFSKESVDKPQSSQNNQHSDDIHSESSDFDVYMSDDDDDADECDSHPAKTNCPVQNNFEALFLPSNVICKTECSSAGNRLVVSETDAAKNERDNSVTSDDEIYSNPSFDDDSETEDIITGTNNLNQIVSCTVDKNSTGDMNGRGGEKNIYLDEDLSVANTLSLGLSDSCPTSATKLQSLLSSDDNSQSETVCLKGKSSALDRHSESSSSNGSGDPVAEMFSSNENLDDFASPFKFKTGADVSLSITSSNDFPHVLEKQVQKPQQNKYDSKRLPSNELNFKSIAQLLLPNPPADIDGKDIETNKKDLKTQSSGVLVVENLPQNYEKKNLDSFLQVFGKVESVTLIPFYDKMTARVKMAGDLEWAVDCINESNAFGAGAEPLRCYVE